MPCSHQSDRAPTISRIARNAEWSGTTIWHGLVRINPIPCQQHRDNRSVPLFTCDAERSGAIVCRRFVHKQTNSNLIAREQRFANIYVPTKIAHIQRCCTSVRCQEWRQSAFRANRIQAVLCSVLLFQSLFNKTGRALISMAFN